MLITCPQSPDAASASPALGDELEAGNIVFFPAAPLPLPSAEDQAFLRDALPGALKLKNVSYHPEADAVRGLDDDPALAARARRILADHGRAVDELLRRIMPELVENWTLGTCSFRPLEEKGRNLKPHASNELVHIDAGAYGATHGNRILRFFVNLNPAQDRVWATKGAFPELFGRFGDAAGIRLKNPRRALQPGPLDRIRSSVITTLAGGGLPLAKMLDSSPYDRIMRRFHNYMKDTPEFQADARGYEEIRFPPFSAWMVLTDTVSHASVSGRFALVTTGIVPLANCRRPELAPFNILRES